jgi:acyl carrier protein
MQAEQHATQAGLNPEQLLTRQILSELTTQNLSPDAIRPEMLINQELGIDSLKFIRLILDVEGRAGRKIFNVETIATIKTVGDLDTVLQST